MSPPACHWLRPRGLCVETHTIDVRKKRTFGIEGYLFRQVPIAIGVLLLGVLAMWFSRGDTDDRGQFFLGLFLVLASLAYTAYAFHRKALPKKALIELSAEGILYRIGQDSEFHIPWHEIRSLGLIDINLRKGAKLRNVTVASVSRDFFDRNVPVKSWWKRGPGWSYTFIPKDDIVQIAFHHDVMSVPAEELWSEIETRWRTLSGQPDAPFLPVPRLPKTWFGGWTPPPAVRRILPVAFAVLAVPAVYFWHWPVVWLLSPGIPHGSADVYLENLLDGRGVQARLDGNGVTLLRGSDLSESGRTSCATEITRDRSRTAFLPPKFVGTTFCTAPLRTTAGVPATGIFKLVVQISESADWEGKMQEYRSWVPAALAEAEVDAALCRLGSCATR